MKKILTFIFSLMMVLPTMAEGSPNILSASPVKLLAIGDEPLEYDLQDAIDQLNRAHEGLNLSLYDFRNLYFIRDIESITTGETSSNINFGDPSNYYAFTLEDTKSEEISVSPRLEGTNTYIKYSAHTTEIEGANPITDYTSIKFCYNSQASATSETIYIVIYKEYTDEKQTTYELVSIPFTFYKFNTCPTTESRVCKQGTKIINFQEVLDATNEAHGTELNINSFPSFILVTDLDQITIGEYGVEYGAEQGYVYFTDQQPDDNLTFTAEPDDNADLYPLSFKGQFMPETDMSLGSLYMTLTGQSYHTTNKFYLVGEENGNEGTFYIFPIKLVTSTIMNTCPTITIKSPLGNEAKKDITDLLTNELHSMEEMAGGNQGVTVLFVYNLDDVDYNKERGLSTTANSYKTSIFGEEDAPTDDYPIYFTYTKSLVNDEGLVCDVEIISNVFLNLKGSTVANKKNFYMVLEASGQNSFACDLEVFPIYTESYNAFQTNSYKGISDENLEKYRYSTSNEPFYIKKTMEDSGETFVMTDPVVTFEWLNKEHTSDKNGYYDVFEALSTDEDILAESMFVSKNNAGELFLTTNEGDVLTIWDEGSIGSYDDNNNVSFNYSLYRQEYSAIEENNHNSNNKPLQIVKTDNGHAIYSKFDTSIYDDNGQGETKKLTAMLFLDYNPATGKFGIMPYDVTGMTEIETDDLVNQHCLQLYTVTVVSDNTPHFQPKNDEVTIDNTKQTNQEIFEDATNPYEIEITFDRELAVKADTDDGNKLKAIDKDGNYVEASELFDIKLADDGTSSSSSAPLRDAVKKVPRSPIVSSTSVKSSGGLTNNVMTITLNSNTTSAAAPKRINKLLKVPRVPVVSSTSVKVSAQAGAFQFAAPVASSSKRKAAAEVDESNLSAAFGFEYHIITEDVTKEPEAPTPPAETASDEEKEQYEADKEEYNQAMTAYNDLLNQVKEAVLNSTTIDINTNEEGIVTCYADCLDTRSTYQLNFYKVSNVDVVDGSGTVTLKKLNGVVSGPMMVMRANESLSPTVTVEKGENPVAITDSYLRYCTANDNDPKTTTDVIPYFFDGVYPAGVASNTAAENYFFGKSKTSDGNSGYTYGHLGFYLLNINQDWQNTRNKGMVYLHNYKRSEDSAPARMKIVLEDGKEVLNVPTSIMSAITDRGNKPTNQYYNVLGQKVGSHYQGIVIKNGKKVINK